MKICFLAASNSIHSHKWINYFADQGYKVIWISLVPATLIYQIILSTTNLLMVFSTQSIN